MQIYACFDFDKLEISPPPLVGVSIGTVFFLHDPLFEEDGDSFLSVGDRCRAWQTIQDGFLCSIKPGVAIQPKTLVQRIQLLSKEFILKLVLAEFVIRP